MTTDKTYIVDAPRVGQDEALELMVHHLQLAAMYFEATSEDFEECLAEIKRLLEDDPRSAVSAIPWYSAISGFYKEVEKRDFT
jgi:hypothetical protein